MNFIYVDNAATTKMKKEVLDSMIPFFTDYYGNPSSNYQLGKISFDAIENARSEVKKAINANEKDYIIFTSGGSEADNLALKGYARANRYKGNHIITSKIEHKAILNTCAELEKEGFEVTYLDVDSNGMINVNELEKSIKYNTILISIMFANNEIGTIEPIKEIGDIAHKRRIVFHTDAVQAIGNIRINVENMNIDMLSMSAHKFGGPKGIGALYLKDGINIQPIINGGHQENNKRAGTENVASIVGMGKAIQIANKNIISKSEKLIYLRDKYINDILRNISCTKLNGHVYKRLPGNANISFEGINAGTLVLLLNEKGIYCSSGSACNSKDKSPSHVLKAIGLSDHLAQSSLRVSFGENNTIEEEIFLIKNISEIVERIRKK